MAISRSCCRRTTAAGWVRDDERYSQSDVQLISTSRFEPQHTAQIDWFSAGQERRAFRCRQSGQVIASASHKGRNTGKPVNNLIGTRLAPGLLLAAAFDLTGRERGLVHVRAALAPRIADG